MENSVLFNRGTFGQGSNGVLNYQAKRNIRFNYHNYSSLPSLASNIPMRFSAANNQYFIEIPIRINNKNDIQTFVNGQQLVVTGKYCSTQGQVIPFKEVIGLPSCADPDNITCSINKSGLTLHIGKKQT